MGNLHLCHNYRHLIKRWRALCRHARLRICEFADADGYPVYEILNPPLGAPTIYLSAGIHGDEPGATEGLLLWAEMHADHLHQWPLRILPALNPFGLVGNLRSDATGRDLNRCFGMADAPPHITELCRRIQGEQYRWALNLHEDYDGEGIYLYEVEHKRQRPSQGERLLKSLRGTIPLDPRKSIDGRRVSLPGLVRRKFPANLLSVMPEALYLHVHHSKQTFTFETPSEFDLPLRAKAHAKLIQAAIASLK